MEKIVVIGGGGHAKVIISILKKNGRFDIAGFTDITEKPKILCIPYLGKDDSLYSLYKNGVENCVIGIGQIKTSVIRKEIHEKVKMIGFELPAIISPQAIVNEEVAIGEGTVVMDGVVINSGTRIGECSIINTKASIDHDCRIGNFTHIAPGVTLSGEVEIGDDVLIGTGSSVIQGIKIANGCLISAGSSVQSSITERGIYRGIPAKLIKNL